MKNNHEQYVQELGAWSHGSLGTLVQYLVGLSVCIGFTLLGFWLAFSHCLDHTMTLVMLVGLAVLQFFTQVYFFFHLGGRHTPRHQQVAIAFATLIVLIVALGSLWVMHDLNGRMMYSPTMMEQYMKTQPGL